jgi:hypothetical protein
MTEKKKARKPSIKVLEEEVQKADDKSEPKEKKVLEIEAKPHS